ncbi:hypothetical protein [Pedococcus sp. 5OH_020]|uniref:hypothetical protein n=1 Tax=Pedococcus sp. 5OH_020 TaxID=2989814 RepID=UPI0022E9A97B|nr:hypothetical protein [Pedococcus sp. 5OH_020]
MRLLRAGVLAATVAALAVQGGSVLQARSAAEQLRPPVQARAASRSHPAVAPDHAVAPVPPQWSFDDARGSLALGRVRPVAAVSRPATATTAGGRPLRRPPKKAATGTAPRTGSPQAVLAAAYRAAQRRSDAGCHLPVDLLAAIGQVESGSVGGRSVDRGHRVTPAIYGPLLDGGPFAVVRDTDGGRYDGASDYDRAVGPLQFLPGTWGWAGRDGDGDGRRDPQNVYDAALATAGYLCQGRNLARTGDLRSAVLSYNNSAAYLSTVLEWVTFFDRHGLAALDDVAFRVGSGGRASALGPAPTSGTSSTASVGAVSKDHPAAAVPAATSRPASTPQPAPSPTSTPTTPPKRSPAPAPSPSPSSPSDPAPTTPAPDPTTTPPPAPTTPVPDPTTPVPDPTTTVPDPVSSSTVPNPTVPTTAVTTTAVTTTAVTTTAVTQTSTPG